MIGHLVLTRRMNEAVRIGADIEVRVVRIDGGAVRLRITAPRELRVLREEICLLQEEEDQDDGEGKKVA